MTGWLLVWLTPAACRSMMWDGSAPLDSSAVSVALAEATVSIIMCGPPNEEAVSCPSTCIE